MITSLILLPFILQMIAHPIDEFFFHIRRGLPKWERIGHPIDTCSVLACVLYTLWVPFSEAALKGYLALALFSCILVTKDEFVHKHHCPAAEQWVHALLFINHPILLGSLGVMWAVLYGAWVPEWLSWVQDPHLLSIFLWIQAIGISLFLLYQVVYWNFIWQEKSPE